MCKTPSEFAFPPPATIKALTVELAGLTAKPGVDEVAGLYMSEASLEDSDFNAGDSIKVKTAQGEVTTIIVSDNKIAGNIALLPTFDSKLNSEALFGGYRFNTASIEKV